MRQTCEVLYPVASAVSLIGVVDPPVTWTGPSPRTGLAELPHPAPDRPVPPHVFSGTGTVCIAGVQRLKDAELLASTGSTGDSYDNVMAESINGLYKAEVIHRHSWKTRAEVELATLTWVDWYNNRRLLERLGHIPPAGTVSAGFRAGIGNDSG